MTKKHLIILPTEAHSQIRVSFMTGGGADFGPEINIKVAQNSCRGVSFIALNAKGGFESFWFNKITEQELQASKDYASYQGSDYSYSEQLITSIDSNITSLASTDFLSNDELEQYSLLVESPLVYVVDTETGSPVYSPVQITTKKLPSKSKELQQLIIEYTPTQERLNQNSISVQPYIQIPSEEIEWENLWT